LFVSGNTYVFTLPASKIHRGQVIGSVDAKDADQGVNGQVNKFSLKEYFGQGILSVPGIAGYK